MASITLTTDATNTAKLQAVVDFYNTRNGTTYNIKQWCVAMLLLAYGDWNDQRINSTISAQLGDKVVVT